MSFPQAGGPGSNRWVVAALVAVVIGVFGVTSSAAATTTRPTILLIGASPTALRASGGRINVFVNVRNAQKCSFRGQHRALAAPASGGTVNCRSGHASIRMSVAANPYHHQATIHFLVTAIPAVGRRVTEGVSVVQAAAPSPPPAGSAPTPTPTVPALAIQAGALPAASVGVSYSVALVASGGSAPYAWSIATGALPAGLTLSGSGVISGTPTAVGQSNFTAQVADSLGQTTTAGFAIAVAGGGIPTVGSSNWSGYVLTGGPFTGASGTFNVPRVLASPTDTALGEWVGLDGATPSDPSIIQAGIGENYSASTNSYVVFAWLELYPAPAYRLPLAVAPGDEMTVAISSVSTGVWNVYVKDDSTGQTYSINQSYSGPALSAEWIVEAPYSTLSQSDSTLSGYTPITFTQLQVNPVAGLLSRWVMVQGGVPVSVPSALSSNGFTVDYGSVTPAAP